MAELSPEARSRLQVLRERLASGDLTAEQVQEARDIVGRFQTTPSAPAGPSTVLELTEGFVGKPAFEALGAMTGVAVGGAAGAPTGPGAIATGLAGGALGAAGGSAIHDNLTDFLRSTGVLETPEGAATGFERAGEIGLRAAQAGVEDVTFAAGGMVAGAALTSLGRPLIGKVLGLRTPEAQEIIRVAQAQGIDVGATTAAQGMGGRAARAISNVMGVFPFMGPVRTGIRQQLDDVARRTMVLLDNFGPNATLQSALGINMIEAAKGARQEFVNVSGKLYNNMRGISQAFGHPKIIPTADIQTLAEELVASRKAGTLFTKDGVPIDAPVDDTLGEFIEQLSNVEDVISIPQFRQLSDDLSATVSKLRADGFDVSRVAQIRNRMEGALGAMDLRPQGAIEIAEAYAEANRFYSEGIVRFQTPTAQKFGRIDRNIFGAGREVPGSINADEAARIVTNLNSPSAIRDLRDLVGEDVMNEAARGWLDNAFESAIREGDEFISPDLLRRNLGLTGGSRLSRESLEEFIGPDTLSNLTKISNTLDNILQMPDVNKFIARRTILGGVRTLVGGVVLAGGTGAGAAMFGKVGVVPVLAATYMARRAGSIMNEPRQMEALTRIITDTTMSNLQRRALFGRILETNGDVLSMGVSGPAEVQNLSLSDAFDHPAAKLVIDFVSSQEAQSIDADPNQAP